jgi:hypothetical protein
VLLVPLPTSIIASIMGVWLFSLQHRFEGALWARHDDAAALEFVHHPEPELRTLGLLDPKSEDFLRPV